MITALFDADLERAGRFCLAVDDLLIDFSKTAIDQAVLAALFELARAVDVEGFLARLFSGDPVNVTEGRAAMHMASRAPRGARLRARLPEGMEDAAALAAAERGRMAAFAAAVHDGTLRGASGEPFAEVLHIGIGGSDLGPRLAVEALTLAHGPLLPVRFLSNVDGHALAGALRGLDPARTLVLVASKTFTTAETMANAGAVRQWLLEALGERAIGTNMAALSANLAATGAFGIPPERVFGFRDWVGGRFSLWSPVGLAIALAAGWEAFRSLLSGAAAMDTLIRRAPLKENPAVLLALIDCWHVNALGARALAVLPYDERLKLLPAYLQQIEMESNGKGVDLAGHKVTRCTAPVIFGAVGTDAQHSFMQAIHQGPVVVPVTFILALKPDHDRPAAHRLLLANALAQSAALMRGCSEAELDAAMAASGQDEATIARLAPHRVCPGNRPSVTIVLPELDPPWLGRLLALYEHKVAIQGALWGIDSFDQWGVDLGKELAETLVPALEGRKVEGLDPSTRALAARLESVPEPG